MILTGKQYTPFSPRVAILSYCSMYRMKSEPWHLWIRREKYVHPGEKQALASMIHSMNQTRKVCAQSHWRKPRCHSCAGKTISVSVSTILSQSEGEQVACDGSEWKAPSLYNVWICYSPTISKLEETMVRRFLLFFVECGSYVSISLSEGMKYVTCEKIKKIQAVAPLFAIVVLNKQLAHWKVWRTRPAFDSGNAAMLRRGFKFLYREYKYNQWNYYQSAGGILFWWCFKSLHRNPNTFSLCPIQQTFSSKYFYNHL